MLSSFFKASIKRHTDGYFPLKIDVKQLCQPSTELFVVAISSSILKKQFNISISIFGCFRLFRLSNLPNQVFSK